MLWIVDRKTGIRYADKWEAALELGISHNYVSKLARGQKTSPNYDLAIEDDGRPEEGRTQLRRGRAHIEKSSEHPKLSRTLCTDCANFWCSWVQNQKPVEGWEAVPCPQNDSYAVTKCPEFRENERRKKQCEQKNLTSTWNSSRRKRWKP